jgi:hypothetical protein
MLPDYGRGLYKQLEEQIRRGDSLESDNRRLKQDYTRIERLLEKTQSDMGERIEQAVAKAISQLVEALAQKDALIKKQSDEIARLKAQINKDSSNSSKPPSSDGFKKIANNRESSGRRVGGQAGHKGHGLRIKIPEDLEELVKAGKAIHEIVDETNPGEPYITQWELDVAVIPVYREIRKPQGKAYHKGYGLTIKAICIRLTITGMMSMERVTRFFRDITGRVIKMSQATVESFGRKAAQNIDTGQYVTDLLNGGALHTDETPVKTTQRLELGAQIPEVSEHTTMNAQVRTYSNDTTVMLTVNAHKDDAGVEADEILPRFMGILSHDHDAKLYKYGLAHATCGAHLCRDLKGLAELSLIAWAQPVREYMLEMNAHKKQDVSKGVTLCDELVLREYEQRYDAFVEEGAAALALKDDSFGYDELRKMLNRLRD